MTVELAEAHLAELEAVAREQGPDGEPRRLLSITDLSQLPPPSWTLDGLLPAGGFTVLYGPSGAGKSFLGLDWGLCIAAGIPWYGREAKAGWVLYIAAEGVSGLYRRAQAWQTARSTDHVDRIRFLPEAVNLLDRQELDGARRTLHELPEPPALIVIDTMARTMVGGDENAARDVGMFIAAVDTLGADSGAGRLVVHHTGKNGEDERGSSALRGAADMMHAQTRRCRPPPRVRQSQGLRALRPLAAAPLTGRRIMRFALWDTSGTTRPIRAVDSHRCLRVIWDTPSERHRHPRRRRRAALKPLPIAAIPDRAGIPHRKQHRSNHALRADRRRPTNACPNQSQRVP